MYTRKGMQQKNKSMAAANNAAQKKCNRAGMLFLIDNRQENVMHNELKGKINNRFQNEQPQKGISKTNHFLADNHVRTPLTMQLALDPVTGRLPIAELTLIGFLNAQGIDIETEIAEDKVVYFQNRFATLYQKNARLSRGPNVPLRDELQTAYADLVIDANNHKAEFLLNDWYVKDPPHEANNRLEMNMTTKYNTDYYGMYNFNVSNRHDAQSYLVPYNGNTLGSNVQNTIVYSGTDDFMAGFRDFGDHVATEMNGRIGGKYTAYDVQTLPVYAPARGPRFESDRAGKNVHSYPVATPNTAITLTNAEHVVMKLILRGAFAPKNHQRFAEAKTQWTNKNANVETVLQGMNLLPLLNQLLND